ncbi:DUF6894 family protein [Microvirga sp. GCM10011540]|uniref:DUF6894 family protein n=1 Tax=Microvirga sp. GCM10011540 TaxID=3317338 RepID=UPI00361C2517
MRFYFHLVNLHERILDDAGVEVSDIQSARQQALKAIYELRQEAELSIDDWKGWQLEIVDTEGNIITVLPLDVPLQ